MRGPRRDSGNSCKEIGKLKSAKSRRTIPLDTASLLPALRQWQMASEYKNGLVFPTSTGAVEHHKNMVRSLEPVMKAAKVLNKDGKPKYALHAFRHYFASWCLNTESRGGLGLPPQDVQRLLGHSSIVMTLDVYGHLFPGGITTASLLPGLALFSPRKFPLAIQPVVSSQAIEQDRRAAASRLATPLRTLIFRYLEEEFRGRI